nr:HAMP domain-containing sensor histidine kinase [Deinococcus piscis]
MRQAPALTAQRTAGAGQPRPAVQTSLRFQITAVIALLAFLPNLVVTVVVGPRLPGVTLAVWIGLVALLSGMIAWLLSGVLLRPLLRLHAEVEEGDFGVLQSDDPTEIRALRVAFAGLLARLGTEQGRRNAFMATLVHDLKTPLIATGHLVHSLTHFDLTPTQKAEISDNLLAENRRLLTLVSQMADAHRFERDDVRLDPHPTDLRSLLERVAGRQTVAADHQLALQVQGAGQAVVDAAVLERAVTNLTDNALRYAQHRVVLSVTAQGLEICDDGPGLSAALDDLAQPFNSQPALIAGQHYTAGTAGLGLFIARRIAEAHGGSLSYARSAAPHALSIFTLHLPEVVLDAPAAAPDQPAPERSAL